MTDETSANPSGGAESGPLTIMEAAERLRGMQGSEAPTDETSQASDQASVEGDEVATETPETDVSEEPEVTDEPADDSEVIEKTPRHTVKVDGKELKVTLDELKKGYQLEADYRQKTGKIAEERRQLETERQHYGNQLKEFIPALHAQIQDKFANVDWLKLSQENPAEYVKLQAEATVASQRLQMAMAEQQRIQSETESQQKAHYAEYLKGEAQKLAEKLPILADPEKGKAVKADLKSFLKTEGYSDSEISTLGDHRAASIAYKAMLYDKAQKAKTVAQTKAVQQNVPKVQKPGTSLRVDPKSAAANAALERFKNSGRPDDLAELLRARRPR